MASKRMYQPPILKYEEDFENWEREIKLWQCVTDLEKKKQTPAIYLSLQFIYHCKDKPGSAVLILK